MCISAESLFQGYSIGVYYVTSTKTGSACTHEHNSQCDNVCTELSHKCGIVYLAVVHNILYLSSFLW